MEAALNTLRRAGHELWPRDESWRKFIEYRTCAERISQAAIQNRLMHQTLLPHMHPPLGYDVIVVNNFMPSLTTSLRRRAKALHRNLRGAKMAVHAVASTDHPLLAHIIPMRRCNLACTYCNEFDDFSKPVPIEEMYRRIDKLGELGTAVVTISGGEPLMHPELDDVIRRIRANGMIAGLITNGYLLVPDRIQRLNRAGLEWLQISIDNVNPDEVSKKSLKVLDKKLQSARRVRRFSREHQFRGWRRHRQSAGCADHRQARRLN